MTARIHIQQSIETPEVSSYQGHVIPAGPAVHIHVDYAPGHGARALAALEHAAEMVRADVEAAQ